MSTAETMLEIQKSIGRIEGRMEGQSGWMRSIDKRVTGIEKRVNLLTRTERPRVPLRFWIGLGAILVGAVAALLGFNI